MDTQPMQIEQDFSRKHLGAVVWGLEILETLL